MDILTAKENLAKFIPFTKVNEALREVSGIVTAELPDKENEVCDYEKSKPYYQKWSEECVKRSDGLSLGNLREMHQLSAVGKAIGIHFDDHDKEIEMTFKVVSDEAWKKVQERVYTGFSQGGRKVGEQVADPVYKGCVRYVANPSEISLVDNPCLAAARFALVKADGTVEMRKFLRVETQEPDARIVALEQEVGLLKAAQAAPITTKPVEVQATPAAVATKKTKNIGGKDLGAENFAYVGDAEKTETWSYPVHEARFVRQSVAHLSRAPQVERVKIRPALIVAAKKVNVDVATEEGKIAAILATMRKSARIYVNRNSIKVISERLHNLDTDLGKLSKGMWEVSRMACSQDDLACLLFCICCEQEYEGDEDSPLPKMLAENLSALTETFIELVDEETREMMAQVKAHAK